MTLSGGGEESKIRRQGYDKLSQPDKNERVGSPSNVDQVYITRVGLRIPESLGFDQWEHAGCQLSGIVDSSSWCLGDWLVYGKENFPNRYGIAIRSAGLEYQTLRNYAWVSRRFDYGRRRSTLSFQHHAEVASLPLEEQEQWLDRAEKEEWTTRKLRKQIRNERIGNVSKDSSGSQVSRIEIPNHRIARWRQAADNLGTDFRSWMLSTLDRAAEEMAYDQRNAG